MGTRRFFLLGAAMTAAGCSQVLGNARVIHFKADTAVAKKDEAVITSRLREHSSGFFPSFSFVNEREETIIRAEGAPTEAAVQFLLGHHGLFGMKTGMDRPWFSQDDILDAAAGFDDRQRPAVHLKLTADAAARMARLSANSIGNILVAELDGEILTSAKITAPISASSLQISLNRSPSEAMLISTILKTGPLSFTPKSIQVQPVELARSPRMAKRPCLLEMSSVCAQI